MFEPMDESFDLAGTDIRPGQTERRGAAERRLRGREPVGGRLAVTFEQLERPTKEPSGSQQAIGFVRQEAPLAFAAGQGAAGNADPREQWLERQTGVALEPFERPVQEASSDRLEEVVGRERLESQQHDIGERPGRSLVEELTEAFHVLGRLDPGCVSRVMSHGLRSRADAMWPMTMSHMARYVKRQAAVLARADVQRGSLRCRRRPAGEPMISHDRPFVGGIPDGVRQGRCRPAEAVPTLLNHYGSKPPPI